MQDINLLPTELKSSKEVLNTSRLLTRLAIAFGFVLAVSGLAGAGVLYYLSNQAELATSKRAELQNNVQSLESTEQKVVLMRDRVTKISEVLADRSKYDLISKYENLLLQMPPEAVLEEAELDTDISKLTIVVPTSLDLEQVLAIVESEGQYSRVKLDNLDYNPSSGYEIVLDLL